MDDPLRGMFRTESSILDAFEGYGFIFWFQLLIDLTNGLVWFYQHIQERFLFYKIMLELERVSSILLKEIFIFLIYYNICSATFCACISGLWWPWKIQFANDADGRLDNLRFLVLDPYFHWNGIQFSKILSGLWIDASISLIFSF